MSNVRVHTVAARSGVTLQLACDTFGPQTVTTNDYRNLLENNGIDALMIALPNAMHAPVLTEAASAGKHIFFLNRRRRTTRTRLAGELAAPRMVSVCL
jgi:predicted dehydrogenase